MRCDGQDKDVVMCYFFNIMRNSNFILQDLKKKKHSLSVYS